ncbi:DELTA-sagatoxin-Srs1a-like [Notolabrus celidotus]|uniref:DELTA-sagatoxin-Srs1a-like n=1 Tax=Notolabrus celidotus TaxID=1203425 RepID=UPI00148FCB03|nr:DELTA-sagatoxin-Srs1a-like [Notolabrus celidotus]
MAPSRQCSIEFENESKYTLLNACYYMHSGFCQQPLPLDLTSSDSGRALFEKTPNTMWGCVGVVMYDLKNNSTNEHDGKMAVMFSNPYNFMQFSNWFAVGVFGMNKHCDYSLYKEMYYSAQKGFIRGKAKDFNLNYSIEAVIIRVTMSDSYKPVIKVKVSDY